jgi:uncharacterized membrane protein
VSSYVVHHDDPHPLARSAAIRSAREVDPATREDDLRLTMSQRLAIGLELSRVASLIKPRKP